MITAPSGFAYRRDSIGDRVPADIRAEVAKPRTVKARSVRAILSQSPNPGPILFMFLDSLRRFLQDNTEQNECIHSALTSRSECDSIRMHYKCRHNMGGNKQLVNCPLCRTIQTVTGRMHPVVVSVGEFCSILDISKVTGYRMAAVGPEHGGCKTVRLLGTIRVPTSEIFRFLGVGQDDHVAHIAGRSSDAGLLNGTLPQQERSL